MGSYREELDIKLASLKEYRDSRVPSLSSSQVIPRRGIGTSLHNPNQVRSGVTKMKVLKWLRVLLVGTLLVIMARLITSGFGWHSASQQVAYVGMAVIILGTLITVGGTISLRIRSFRDSRPKRGIKG